MADLWQTTPQPGLPNLARFGLTPRSCTTRRPLLIGRGSLLQLGRGNEGPRLLFRPQLPLRSDRASGGDREADRTSGGERGELARVDEMELTRGGPEALPFVPAATSKSSPFFGDCGCQAWFNIRSASVA